MPPPDLRLRPPRYVTVEQRGMIFTEERQRARDWCAGVHSCGETADTAGHEEGGERGNEPGERRGWGVGG